MSDNKKTKKQLVQELRQLRQKVAALEKAQSKAVRDGTQALYEISRGLSEAHDEDELLQALVPPAQRAGASAAVLMYIDLDEAGEPEWLEMAAVWQPEGSAQTDLVPAGSRFYLPDFLFSSLWMANPDEPQLIADVTQDERIDENFGDLLAQMGSRALVTIPLTQAGRWVGVVNLSWEEPHEFSPQEAQIYAALTDLASPAVENRRLVDNLEQVVAERTAQFRAARDETQALYEISRGLSAAGDEAELLQVLAQPAQQAGADSVSLIYIDSDQAGAPEWGQIAATWQKQGTPTVPVGTRFYLPEMPFSQLWIADPDEPRLIPDALTDERVDENTRNAIVAGGIRAIAIVPLTQAGRWIGLLTFNWTEAHAFSPQEMELYRALIGLAAPAVTSRRLLIERERALTETLYSISRGLSEAHDEDELLRALIPPAQRAGASGAVLMYIDLDEAGEPEWLEMAAMWQPEGGAQMDLVPAGSRFYLPDFLFSSLWMANPDEPQLIADVTQDERIDENFGNLLAQMGSRALVTIPLTQAGRWVGLVNLSWEEPHEFSPQEAQIYAALTDLASPAVDSRRLAQQTEAALAQTETLYNASQMLITASEPEAMLRAIAEPVLETGLGVAALFYVDADAEGQPEWIEMAASVQTIDAPGIPIGTRYYVPDFPLSRLLIADPERALTISDLEQHEAIDENTLQILKVANAQSFAAIPLTLADPTLGRRWLGVITLSWPQTHEFSPRERRLYGTLAPQLATLIENRRLLEQIQYRARRLQTASQVSRAASSFLDSDELIQQVVNLVREQFDLYYVGLFLADRAGQWAVLRAGTGEAGQQMLESGHKLEIGGESMIGACVAQAQARIALDVGQEAVRFENPFLPETRSEMALPLIARGQAIGAMTVQSVEEAAFSQADVTALQNMADQVANAIENARLFEQTQIALAEARQSEQLLRSIIDATPDLIFVKDPEHRFQLVNRSFADALGLGPQDFIGKDDIEVGFPEERVRGDPEKGIRGFWADDDQVIEGGEPLHSPRDTVVIDDEPRIMNFAKIPLRDAVGNVWGLLGIGRDVTERENLLADLQQRSQDLQTAAEVSGAISSILDPDELNQQVVNLVQERFGLYYAGLFLVDQAGEWSGEPNKWAVLRAGTGKAGQVMMMQGHKLEIGGDSMIGACVAQAQARIALDVREPQSNDVGQEAVRFENPFLPETRSEMALPLIARGQTIGAITIQSEKEAAFSEQDITVLQTVADQVATAIQNGRLYQESIVLYMASQAVSQAETVEEALAGAARHIIGPLYDVCAVLTFVEPGQHESMEVLTTWEKHPGATPLPVGAIVSQKRFPLYNLVTRQETTIFNDLLQDERLDLELARRIKASGVQSALAIPLIAGPNWLGILLAQGSHATAIGPEERRAFESLAHQLGAFIQNARLLEETQRSLQEIQRLHRSYISEAWQEYLSSTEETTVTDYMLDQRQLVPNPGLDLPEIDLALQQNRTVVGGQRLPSQPDETMTLVPGASETHSMIVAPISLRDQVIGTLGIHDPSGERHWDEDDIALLEAVSIQLGLAIDNARLSEQTRTSLAETQTLFDTSRNLAAAQGIEEIQHAIIEAAGTRRVDACALFLFDSLERNTARELVLVAGWDRQGSPRLPVGARLPLDSFELFDTLSPDQPFPVTDLDQAENIDQGTRNLLSALGFMALLHQPIAVRGRWFGLLTVLHESPHPFSRAEINFYRTLADQAALAIEGQRLLTETQQRAEREQLIRQVTEKVHDTPDMETILQTTVQELSKAMGLPRVFVRLGTKDTLKRP